MRKLFLIIILVLFSSSNAFSLSKDMYNYLFTGCKFSDNEFWNAMCTCYTDKMDKKFNDEQLIKFAEENKGKFKEHPLIRKYTLDCTEKYKHLGIFKK